jgi:uncharacterized protein (DUF362 family)/NAD-dependent dihydropyrimidine dehydrogenase PreA subunit
MDKRVSVRRCDDYNAEKIESLFSEIYLSAGGPDPKGKKVLLKPNILTDDDPRKAISTHPVFVEAAVKFFYNAGASEVLVGDSPAVHKPGFTPQKSGIADVCRHTGATWVNFLQGSKEVKLNRGRIKIARAAFDVDLIISLPKLKTHELMYLTAAIKNTLGLVPGFNKTAQHALHFDRRRFGKFLVDLNEAVTPSFFMIDGITAMEGPGPGNGMPVHTGLIIGSCNPLAADIIASEVTGYKIMDIATNRAALERGLWLKSPAEIDYDGPERESIICRNFRRVPVIPDGNMAIKFIIRRVRPLRRLEKRPIFNSNNCIGCQACVKICPVQVLSVHPKQKTKIIIQDNKCIRCFCCHEVCPANAIEVKKKLF